MGRTDKVNLQEDESLAEEVKKYPCLFDKSSKHYKDKRKTANAWAKVDESLGYEDKFYPDTFCFFSFSLYSPSYSSFENQN